MHAYQQHILPSLTQSHLCYDGSGSPRDKARLGSRSSDGLQTPATERSCKLEETWLDETNMYIYIYYINQKAFPLLQSALAEASLTVMVSGRVLACPHP